MVDITPARRVREALRALGLIIQIRPMASDEGNCPFDWEVHLNWENKTLIISPERWALQDADLVALMIHEGGHALACNCSPNDSDEDSFFGWEYTLAQQCAVLDEWTEGHADYAVPVGDHSEDLGTMSADVQQETFIRYTELAVRNGLVWGGRPQAIR